MEDKLIKEAARVGDDLKRYVEASIETENSSPSFLQLKERIRKGENPLSKAGDFMIALGEGDVETAIKLADSENLQALEKSHPEEFK